MQKQTMTADGRYVLEDPSVSLGVNDDLCMFENGWDRFCISTITPMARIGFKWDQKFDQTDRNDAPVYEYWQIDLKPFGKFQGYFDLIFHIEKLISIETIFDLEQFEGALDLALIVNEKLKACVGIGYEHERVYASWKVMFQIYNCTKSIIDNIFDMASIW